MPPTSRPFRDSGDIPLIHDLLRKAAKRDPGPVYLSIADFEWWQVNDDDPDSLRTSWLWFDSEERLVAFTWPGESSIDYAIHPDRADLEPVILDDWLSNAESFPGVPALHCADRNLRLIQALKARGFTRVRSAYNDWTQPLGTPRDRPVPPARYGVRAFRGEEEIESRVAVHRSAFHPSSMTVGKHRRAMASPLYRQDLDLVAVAPDGEIAAYALVWFDPVNRTGLFEPVGTHADHRRRGLARLVVLEGLRRLQALGATQAFVGSAYDDEPSDRLYASCGFEVAGVVSAWARRQET